MPPLTLSVSNSKLKKTGKVLAQVAPDRRLVLVSGHVHHLRDHAVAAFNLPAGKSKVTGRITCPWAGACFDICYARQGRYIMPNVALPREDNLAELLRVFAEHCRGLEGERAVHDALDDAVRALPANVGVVRLHDSGDFFAPWYLRAWLSVIWRRPDLLFYAYTKSVGLVLRAGALPPNLVITFSEGGKQDGLIPESAARARIFAVDGSHNDAAAVARAHRARSQAGYVDGNSEDGDLPAILGMKRIGLVYHGVKIPTVVQQDALVGAVVAK